MADLRVLVVTEEGDHPETGNLIKLHQAGVKIKVLGWEDSPYVSWLADAGVPFEPLRLAGKRDREGARLIARHLDEYRPQILHLLRKRTIFNGLAAAKGRPVKIVLYRGIVGNVSFLNPIDWISFLNPRVDRIVCVAEAVRQEFLHLGFAGLGIPPEKLVTIHKGHDLDWYRDPPADLGQLGIPSSSFVVICVVNVRPRKGVPLFIDACASLPADLGMRFVLVGRGMDSPELLKRVARSPHPDRFHVLGFRNDAARLIAASDVSVLASLRREGLPRSIIESMSYRTTPVVSDAGGSPELVENERSGLVVPAGDAGALADAIMRLARDRDWCRALGENARERIARHFNVDMAARKTLELYRDLTA
ncbi:glycosyltransferase family 4 protein [Candidatus Rariloculus sp.]|uniref:glycosyltransferase family 4 protein n=1 Tax=Candidatus Rariloculus sp. TaxID=3101265 RepID=UPI003D0D934D